VCQPSSSEEKASKYKCPQCSIRFCSLECFKKHKNESEAKYYCANFQTANKTVNFEKQANEGEEEEKQ
jgi:HIT zinc finger